MKRIIILGVVIFLVACKQDATQKSTEKAVPQTQINPQTDSQPQTQEPQNTPKKELDPEVAARLYARYTDNPVTQDQKDENLLIEYAIDNGLDVTRTDSGLYYYFEEAGFGANVQKGQMVKVHYNGKFLDGRIFDSSYKRGIPLMANHGLMNPGWNEALLLMKAGTKRILLLPSKLGYGARGFPGYVPPNTPIVFDIELLY